MSRGTQEGHTCVEAYQVGGKRVEGHVVGVSGASGSKVDERTVPGLVVLQQHVMHLLEHHRLVLISALVPLQRRGASGTVCVCIKQRAALQVTAVPCHAIPEAERFFCGSSRPMA